MRRIINFLVVTGLAIGLSGCLKMDMDLDVKPNANVDGVMVVGLSTEAIKLVESFASASDTKPKTNPFDKKTLRKECADTKGAPKGAKVEGKLYDKGGFLGCEIKFSGIKGNQLSTAFEDASGDLGDSVDQSDSTDDTDIQVVRRGNNLVFTMRLGADSSTTQDTLFDTSALEGLIKTKPQVRIKVSFPGKVLKASKGGKVSGKSVTWQFKDLNALNTLKLEATAKAS